MNVSFSTKEPSEYIDCGTTRRNFTPGFGAGEPEDYVYETAKGSTTFKMAVPNPQNPTLTMPFSVHRRTNLEGRTNIYLAPKGDKAEISVNTRYIFTQNLTATHLVSGQRTTEQGQAVSFNTGKTGDTEWGGMVLECVSKGVIEEDIIKAARP